MQAVRVMMAGDVQAGPAQLGLQLQARIDTHVAARHLVVLTGQSPADPLRQPAWHRDGGDAARLQHPGDLVHGLLVVEDVLEDLGRDDPVERGIGERHRGGITGHGRAACRGGGLPLGTHRLARARHRCQLPGIQVERHHVRAAPVRLERMPPGTAAHVQDAGSGGEPEPAVVDGQQGFVPPAMARA